MALQNNNVKIKIPFQHFVLLIVKIRILLKFSSKTDTCNAIAQKIHKRINYQPIQFWNVSIHPIEHTKVNNYFFESLFLRARSQRCKFISQNCRVIVISKRSCIYPRGKGRQPPGAKCFLKHTSSSTWSLASTFFY